MARMGHESSRAALIYQHATADADRGIADAVSAQVEAEQKKARKTGRKRAKRPPKDGDDGAAGALVPAG